MRWRARRAVDDGRHARERARHLHRRRPAGARGNDAASLQKIKGPILLITGDEKNDIAYANGKSTFEAINHTPIFYGWQTELQHIGTFGAKNAGENGAIAVNWLNWVTRAMPMPRRCSRVRAARSARTAAGTCRRKRSTADRRRREVSSSSLLH